jgi:predicted glycosyltransferase
MKILIDIGHPAHVHLFKNMAHEMIKKGHEFFFTVRESEHQAQLLEENGFSYAVIGKKQTGPFKKLLGIFGFTYEILRIARHFRPDLYLSHGSMYAGYAAFLTGKKHIALEDTGNMEQLFFSRPVSDVILSPRALLVELGKKQIRYNGFHELAYLHPNRFKPEISVLNELKVSNGEPYVILRFVSWNATHDFGQSGLTFDQKTALIEEILKYAKVFISSEKPLPPEWDKYALNIAPGRFHHALFFAAMYIGEGATTASECTMLGTPALYVNTISAGTLMQQERYGLAFCFHDSIGLINKVHELFNTTGLKDEFRKRRDNMLSQNIDVTSLLVWFVENWPESRTKMVNDPSFQYSFL